MTKIVLKCPSCGHMIDFGPNWVPVDISTPMTHADVIRSMNDETLAKWLDDLLEHCNDGPCYGCAMEDGCSGSMIEWLKSPVGDDADG